MIRYTKQLVKEIITGIFVYGLAGEILVLSFCREERMRAALGLLLGLCGAACMLLHMSATLEGSLDLGEKNRVSGRIYRGYALRVIVLLLGIFLAYSTGLFNMIAVFAGLLGLKAGIYIQPLIHKLSAGKTGGNERVGKNSMKREE